MHLKYLASLYFPCCVLIFLYTGPHQAIDALAWTLSLWLLILADFLSPDIHHNTDKYKVTDGFYDTILYVLTAMQFVIISLLLVYASQLQWTSIEDSMTSIVNLLVLRILVGTVSGSSAIIVAHELIHRQQLHMRFMGRLLLYTVCYEHFVISHLQNHHPLVATPNDIATAQLDESFTDYWRRVSRAHFKYAWQAEMRRLDLTHSSGFHYKLLANTVLQGLLIKMLLLLVVFQIFGMVAVFIFLLQALSAVRLLETINYYQHWGLGQQQANNTLAWVNQSSVTQYALVGLANHTAHHQDSSTPFQETPHITQGPKMPYGYFVTNLWVKLHNASYRKASKKQIQQFFQETRHGN